MNISAQKFQTKNMFTNYDEKFSNLKSDEDSIIIKSIKDLTYIKLIIQIKD